MSETTDEKRGTIYKWRGLSPGQAVIWANLRLDRIEKLLDLSYDEPDIQSITDKMYEEATEKKTYTPYAEPSTIKEHLVEVWVAIRFGLRYFFNAVFRLDNSGSQDSTTDNRQDKTNNTKDSRC